MASACTPPPPTVDGRLFTSPVRSRSPSSAMRRYVRGSSSGSGPSRCRSCAATSSLAKWRRGAYGAVRSMRWLRPFSSITTDQPAAVSTSATVDPPGPEPTMTASQSQSVTTYVRAGGNSGVGKVDALPAAARRGCRRTRGRRRWPRRRGGAVRATSAVGRRRRRARGRTRRATSSIRVAPGVLLPRPEFEPATGAVRPVTRRRPDARRIVVERGQQTLDVVHRAEVAGARAPARRVRPRRSAPAASSFHRPATSTLC